jgi:hypothetical protein
MTHNFYNFKLKFQIFEMNRIQTTYGRVMTPQRLLLVDPVMYHRGQRADHKAMPHGGFASDLAHRHAQCQVQCQAQRGINDIMVMILNF